MTNALTARSGALFVQPGGPNTASYYVGNRDLGDITIPDTTIDLIRCFASNGNGWVTVGEKQSMPGKITLSVDALMFQQLDWLEKITCPASFFIMMRSCGRPDILLNYDRGVAIGRARRANRKYAGLVKQNADDEAKLSSDWEAWPPAYMVQQWMCQRKVTVNANVVNDIACVMDSRCYSDCGATQNPGDLAVTAPAGGAAVAYPDLSSDGGTTWTAAAAGPFVITKEVMAVERFYTGRNTVRVLAAMTAPAGAQGLTAYSDDTGATWTPTNLGGATAGHGASYGSSLFALDAYHIWLAGAAGYIYFSADGGVTWTVQEPGSIHAGVYNGVKFVDNLNGIAWGAAGIVAKTNDGGLTWKACTVPGVVVLYAGDILDSNRFWVGGASGSLWYTTDGGVTWTTRTTFAGAGTGSVRGLSFYNDLVGWMAKDTAGPVGSVLRTFDGGWSWETVPQGTMPTNVGLNGILALSESSCYTWGKVVTATGFIAKVTGI